AAQIGAQRLIFLHPIANQAVARAPFVINDDQGWPPVLERLRGAAFLPDVEGDAESGASLIGIGRLRDGRPAAAKRHDRATEDDGKLPGPEGERPFPRFPHRQNWKVRIRRRGLSARSHCRSPPRRTWCPALARW